MHYKKEKRKDIDLCNICGKSKRLTWDHVPPKCCNNRYAIKTNSWMEGIPEESSYTKKYQNGIKFRSLCDELVAADSVIVPVQAHYLPLKGMTQLMKTIGKVQRQLNPNLKIDGVLLTLADMRTKLARTTEDSLRENYGKHIRIFKTVIPVAITAAESSVAGQSIYEYDKNGTVAKAYAEFTREVIQCGEKQRNKHGSSLSR